MTETPPRFGSKRFREILIPALRGKPITALAAMYWFVTRRRVRGWGRLLIAASQAPYDYQRWTAGGEKRAMAEFRDAHASRADGIRVVAVVIPDSGSESDVNRSIESARVGLGEEVAVASTISDVAGLQQLAREDDQAWLLPILAGDQVSPMLGDILRRLPPDVSTLAYWDEDRIEPSGRSDPWIKPDWDPVLFGQLNGLGGASVVRAAAFPDVVGQLGDGAPNRKNLERILKGIARVGRPTHIPLVLTHRSERNALRRDLHVGTRSGDASVDLPSISVVIPTRDRPDLIAACLRGLERTEYPGSLELIIIDNGTRDPEALQLLDRVSKELDARVIRDDREFNFSRLNNSAASAAGKEFLCFLNNDVECIDDDWLKVMVSHALADDVGAVGAQLLYPSGRIQHAGVAIGLGGAAGHVQKGVDPWSNRFWTWHAVTRQVTAVTAAAMVIRKSRFLEVGGFDETAFPVAFNDVDLCLRLTQAGYTNIYVAEARLLHRESESRGDDRARANATRFAKELSHLQQRWQTRGYIDPHFSPLFSRAVEPCVLAP